MSILDQPIRVEVAKTSEEDEESRFGSEFIDVEAKIFHEQKKDAVGYITATLIDRQAIPENGFLRIFDEHSALMEWVAASLLEERLGRTRLQSLQDYDDPEFDFMLITSFGITDQVLAKNSDVTTAALYHFLRDPSYIKGNLNYGCWKVSSAAYVLPNPAYVLPNPEVERKRKREDINSFNEETATSIFAAPFLRNGFFQDPALIRTTSPIQDAPDNSRILVASYGDWNRPGVIPRSQLEVSTIRILSLPQPSDTKMSVKDAEIMQQFEQVCSTQNESHLLNMGAIMLGLERYEPRRDETTTDQLKALRLIVRRLVAEGGSIAHSTALHVACRYNKIKVVGLLLDIATESNNKSAILSCKNHLGLTPLMVAARSAAGRLSRTGIDDTLVLDQLLSAGSDKSTTDSIGMTAYGYFRKSSKTHIDITDAHCRGTLIALESKLCPLARPTMVDLADGKGPGTGLVDYGPIDDLADREMGRGRYA